MIITFGMPVTVLFNPISTAPQAGGGDEVRGRAGGDGAAGDGLEREALLCRMPPGAESGRGGQDYDGGGCDHISANLRDKVLKRL